MIVIAEISDTPGIDAAPRAARKPHQRIGITSGRSRKSIVLITLISRGKQRVSIPASCAIYRPLLGAQSAPTPMPNTKVVVYLG